MFLLRENRLITVDYLFSLFVAFWIVRKREEVFNKGLKILALPQL